MTNTTIAQWTEKQRAALAVLIEGKDFSYTPDDADYDEVVSRLQARPDHATVFAWDEDGESHIRLTSVYKYIVTTFEISGVFSVEICRFNHLDDDYDFMYDVPPAEYKTERGATNYAKKLVAQYDAEWNGVFYGENEG